MYADHCQAVELVGKRCVANGMAAFLCLQVQLAAMAALLPRAEGQPPDDFSGLKPACGLGAP